MEVHNFKMQFMRVMGLGFSRVVKVGLVGFLDEFDGAHAPFPRYVTVFCHKCEECEYEVVGCVW
jgi:hypothetical protein